MQILTSEKANEAILALSGEALAETLARLPKDPLERFILFVEIIRANDCRYVFKGVPPEGIVSRHERDIMYWGWNLAAEHLFCDLSLPEKFPLTRSTPETRGHATRVLYGFGTAAFLRILAEHAQFGLVAISRDERGFHVRRKEIPPAEIEKLDFMRLNRIQNTLKKRRKDLKWPVILGKRWAGLFQKAGSYLVRTKDDLEKFELKNLSRRMERLLYSIEMGFGKEVRYKVDDKVEAHYTAAGLRLGARLRDKAGLLPAVKFKGVNGSVLSGTIAYVLGMHIKQSEFSWMASKCYPDSDVKQSLTRWRYKSEVEAEIAEGIGFDLEMVKSALAAMTLRSDDIKDLGSLRSVFYPMIIDLGNGLLLFPLFSIDENPYESVIFLQEWRDSNARNLIARDRESWMREGVYNLFQGNKYFLVPRSIKITVDKKELTDIDAAIYDRVTGELALFQLKWQDYATNEPKKQRSKISNLRIQMQSWADGVNKWMEIVGLSEMITALQLKVPKGKTISKVHLFGISHAVANGDGYDMPIEIPGVTLSNWARFQIARIDVGPGENVFSRMVEALRKDDSASIKLENLPYSLKAASATIHVENMWVRYHLPANWA